MTKRKTMISMKLKLANQVEGKKPGRRTEMKRR